MTNEQPAPRMAIATFEGETYYGILDDSEAEYAIRVVTLVNGQREDGLAAGEVVVTDTVLHFMPDELQWKLLAADEWWSIIRFTMARERNGITTVHP